MTADPPVPPPSCGGRSRRRLRRVAAVAFAGWAASVWLLSSSSDPRGVLSWSWETPDFVAHAAEFAVGGALARAALGSARRAASPAVWALLVCAVWGFADEIHQGFVPGRSTDPLDLAADVTGAAAGVALYEACAAAARRKVGPAR